MLLFPFNKKLVEVTNLYIVRLLQHHNLIKLYFHIFIKPNDNSEKNKKKLIKINFLLYKNSNKIKTPFVVNHIVCVKNRTGLLYDRGCALQQIKSINKKK